MTRPSPSLPDIASSTGRTFSLATLLLAMTIVSVWLSCFILNPLLAMLLCIPLAFAFLRTRRAITVRAIAGNITPSGRKAKTFVVSFFVGIVICLLCVVVAGISWGFLTVCKNVFDAQSNIPNPYAFLIVMLAIVGMFVTVLAAQITTIYFIWSTWPRQADALNEDFY